MGKLCMTLPPFSPDYSGVCSALFPFDALTVIHDASGCTGNYTGYDEPRWYGSRSPIYCSGLREIDAILGDDEKLIQKVLYALEDIKPEIIALVGSPVPMVIGTDMDGVAAEIEDRTGIMSVGFSTTGLKYYPQGIEMVYKKVVQRILESDTSEITKVENSVNILGASPLDFGKSDTIEKLEAFLVESGLKVNVDLWKNVSKAEVVRLKNASCNIVVSNAGIELAEYMKKSFGIPYITGLPYGEKYSSTWIDQLKGCMSNQECKAVSAEINEENTSKILIIGEQLQANSIRNALRVEYQLDGDVAGICGWNTRFAEENDRFMETEEDIVNLLNDDSYEIIIGDILYQDLIDSNKTFYPYSHYAVSSKLGDEHSRSLIKCNLF
ncbi:nitrogenase component 1 [Anaerosporobacter sp.]